MNDMRNSIGVINAMFQEKCEDDAESAIFRAQKEIDGCISKAKAIADRLVSGEANNNDGAKANHKEVDRFEEQKRELQRLRDDAFNSYFRIKTDENGVEISEPLQYTTHSDVGYVNTKPITTFNHIGYINPNLQGGK